MNNTAKAIENLIKEAIENSVCSYDCLKENIEILFCKTKFL